MTKNDLNAILQAHKKWLNNPNTGKRADLSGADLRNADLHGAVLRNADLHNADLSGADLRNADLRNADLRNADLSGADLLRAVLHNADLSGADLRNADLRNADLSGADLLRAVLHNADLSGADLLRAVLHKAELRCAVLQDVRVDYSTCGFFLACPSEGSFTAFKKAGCFIIVLEVPADAKRSSATTCKCRCSKAKVLRIENLDGSIAAVSEVRSDHDCDFIYKVGAMVEVPDFDDERWNECSKGIHFFTDRATAVNY